MQAFGVARYPAHRRQARACQWRFRLMPLPSVRLSIAARVPMAIPRRAGLLLSLVSLRMPVPELTVMPMTIQAAWLHALGLTISSPSAVIDNNAANTFQRGLSGCSL
jgi:hypothetical protein